MPVKVIGSSCGTGVAVGGLGVEVGGIGVAVGIGVSVCNGVAVGGTGVSVGFGVSMGKGVAVGIGVSLGVLVGTGMGVLVGDGGVLVGGMDVSVGAGVSATTVVVRSSVVGAAKREQRQVRVIRSAIRMPSLLILDCLLNHFIVSSSYMLC